MKPTAPWLWSREQILEVLGTRVAMAAVAGRPSPIAARVLERLVGKGA